MGEPSKEAIEEADRITQHLAAPRVWTVNEARDYIAAALQRHIERAEASEARVKRDELWRDAANEHAEKRTIAEASKAALIREVRECVRTCQGNSALFAILDKHGGQP